MNTDSYTPSSIDTLPQTAKDVAQRGATAAKNLYQTLSAKAEDGMIQGKEYAQHTLDVTKDAAQQATQTAKDMYQTAAAKVENTLVQSKQYVRQNPFPVVLGAFIFGVTIGCMIGMTQREEPTFRQRFRW